MRKVFRYLVMAMILVTVSVMSALTAMRIAIHGRETTVPNFAKLSPSEAERVAMANGLQVTMEGQFYSTDVPDGLILSQMPPPGTRVRRGWRVRLAQSLGPQRVVIPDLLGQSTRAAELNVRQRGLELGTVAEAHLPDTPTQQIVAQSPPPLAKEVESPKLSVLIASDPEVETFMMPNFVGTPLADATFRIDKAGLKARANVGSAQGSNIVIHQFPAPGQKVTADTPIQLEAGTLPSKPAAPDLQQP